MLDKTNLVGKPPSVCKIFRGEWVEKIIETVKKACPEAESPIRSAPLWAGVA